MARDRSKSKKTKDRPAAARILHALAPRPGERLTVAEIAEATGLATGSIEYAARGAKLKIADVVGAVLTIRNSNGSMIWAEMSGITPEQVEALVGPLPPPVGYLGHVGTGGDVTRLLVAAAPAPISLAALGIALQRVGARGTKEAQDRVRKAVARVQRERAERGEAETIIQVVVEGSTGFAWASAEAAAAAGGEVDEPAPVDAQGYWGRPPMRITLPSVDGAYVFTQDGLFRDGALQSRGGSFPNPEMRY